MAFRHQKYGSVSKWSWQYAQRADYAHSAMAYQHQNTEVYRSGHGNAHSVPIMPTPQWLFGIKNTEVYRSGHNGPHSKCGNGVTRSWVRIPPLPPTPETLLFSRVSSFLSRWIRKCFANTWCAQGAHNPLVRG